MPDEVRMLSNRKALLFIRGERPVMDAKYPLKRHPNYRRTADGGKPPYQKKFDIPHYERADIPAALDPQDIEIIEFTEESDYEKQEHAGHQDTDQTGQTPLFHAGALLDAVRSAVRFRFGRR